MIIQNTQQFLHITHNQQILALDHGSKKIGVAISDSLHIVASPILTIIRTNIKSDLIEMQDIISIHNSYGIVIGLPLEMDSSIGEQAVIVQKFATKLEKLINQPILLWDERFTTKSAQTIMRNHNVKRKKRDIIDDQIAATLILQSLLDNAFSV